MFRLAVIGAGASGVFAAIQAKKTDSDLDITLFEHLEKPLKKILATGNGRCNFTNTDLDYRHFHGNGEIIKSVLNSEFAHIKTNFLEKGLLTYEEDGRIYPRSRQASSVRDFLLKEIEQNKIHLITETEKTEIKKEKDGFSINGNPFDAVIIACGNKAAPAQGSDGSIFESVKKLGHSFTEIKPALTAFNSKDKVLKEWKGLRVKGTLTLYENNRALGQESGEIQFTDKCISGIPAFDLSYLCPNNGGTVAVDFCEEISEKDLYAFLLKQAKKKPWEEAETALAGIVPTKIGYEIINRVKIPKNTVLANLKEQQIRRLATELKHFSLTVNGTRGFEDAQIACGGIKSEEIDAKTLMSKKAEGLFFCGEILDVNGDCGGYNLHFAFASGGLAGFEATRFIHRKKDES